LAKRFIDTSLFSKKWIRELDVNMKLFWVYLLTKCDHAGIWDVDIELAAFQIGVDLDESKILETFNRKIIPFKSGKWFIPKFIDYQYGELNENVNAHKSVIKILNKYGLNVKNQLLPNSSATDQDKDKDKDKVKDKKKEQIKKIDLLELKDKFPNKNVELEFAKWSDYMLAKGKTYRNYHAAFRNWLRNDQFDKKDTNVQQFKKTKTGLYIAYCKKCSKKNYPNDYQLKQSSCCGVDWIPTLQQ
tara:strand:- start:308 stop:1039 length:732 start_codon:yes stop_codon:yes gene_type:complete